MPYYLPPPRYSSTVSELAGCIGVWGTRLYAQIKRLSVYAAKVYGSKSWGRVGRHCPQALGQTVVITSKQASGAKQAGRGRGRCTQVSLWVWHIDKHCYDTNAGNPAYTFFQQRSTRCHVPLTGTKLYWCWQGHKVWTTCPQSLRSHAPTGSQTRDLLITSPTPNMLYIVGNFAASVVSAVGDAAASWRECFSSRERTSSVGRAD